MKFPSQVKVLTRTHDEVALAKLARALGGPWRVPGRSPSTPLITASSR